MILRASERSRKSGEGPGVEYQPRENQVQGEWELDGRGLIGAQFWVSTKPETEFGNW